MLIVVRPVVSRPTVNGNAEDAFTLLQIVETRVYQAVAVVLARGLGFGQPLGFGERQFVEFLFPFRRGDVDGIGDAVANGYQVIAIVACASGIYTHISGIATSASACATARADGQYHCGCENLQE